MPQPLSQLDSEAQRIIATYTVLYKLIFKFGGLLIALGAAVIVFVVNLMGAGLLGEQFGQDSRQTVLLRQAQKRLSVSTGGSSLRMEMVLGVYSATGGRVISLGNLGFIGPAILPNVTNIDANIDLSNIRSDLQSPEDVDAIKRRYDTIVFVFPPVGIDLPSPIQPLLISPEGMLDQFSLACTQGFKLFDGICSYYVGQFLDRFWVYRLSQHVETLSRIQKSLDPSQQDRFCKGIVSYVIVTNDISINADPLMSQCASKYQQEINRAKSLITLQKQLLNNQGSALINDELFSDPLVNGFKLMSAQQLLYQDFAIGRPDFSRIDGYLDFVQKLTKKPESITGVTFDMMYYFNTAYLAPQLINPVFASTPDRTTKSTKSTNKLAEINKGSTLGGFPPLTSLISNQSLPVRLGGLQGSLNPVTGSVFSGSVSSGGVSAEDVIRSYFRVPRLNIQQQSISGSRATIAGIGQITIQDQRTIQFPVSFVVSLTGKNVSIQSVGFSGYTNLTTTINNLIKQKPLSLSQLYDTVVSNAELFTSNQTNQLMMCDVLRAGLPESINSCTATGSVFSQQIDDKNVVYRFQISGYEIRSVSVSQTGIQQLIDKQKIPVTTNLTLVSTIKSLLSLRVVPIETSTTTTTPIALMTNTFQTYLGIKPTSIDETAKSDKYAIDMTIKGVVFRVQYDYPSSTIERILIVVGSNRVAVKNASLVLKEPQKADLNRFVQNPIEYLRSISPDSIAEYDKLTQ